MTALPERLHDDPTVTFAGNIAAEVPPDAADLVRPAAPAAPDLHVEARSVAARTRDAQDSFEVAVLLATMGYGDRRARELGCRDLFDLAEQLLPLLPLFQGPDDETPVGANDRVADEPTGPDRLTVGLVLRSLLYSAPWLIAVAALVVSRVSFWATITTQQFASAISLALFVALIITGGPMQAFARRGVFYALQRNRPLLMWSLRWTLGAGLVVLVAAVAAIYVVLEPGLHAYTPASTRAFLLFGVSIGALLLAFCPLFLARAVGEVLLASALGGAVAIVGGRLITHGHYLNPYTAQWVQLAALWTATLVAVACDVWVLRRLAGGPSEAAEPEQVRAPRMAPVARSVAGYAVYGAGFFVLLVADQLVAGGLWKGSFHYDGRYELAVGAALLVLIPTLTYATAAAQLLPATVMRELRGHSVSQSAGISSVLGRFYRRHLVVTALVGVAAAVVLLAAGEWLSTAFLVTYGLSGVYGLFAAALAGYLLLGIGALNTGLLFSFGRSTVPAASAWAGAGVSLVLGVVLARTWDPAGGAVTGLLAGTLLFAVATTVAAAGAFRQFDVTYYRAF